MYTTLMPLQSIVFNILVISIHCGLAQNVADFAGCRAGAAFSLLFLLLSTYTGGLRGAFLTSAGFLVAYLEDVVNKGRYPRVALAMGQRLLAAAGCVVYLVRGMPVLIAAFLLLLVQLVEQLPCCIRCGSGCYPELPM